MKPLSMLTALITLCILTSLHGYAQNAASAEPLQTGVVLVKLSLPVYPPLARQARIMGDVGIRVEIRRDGSVASADVIGGHPMLKQAALDSARKSQFECRGRSEGVTSYSLTYTFALDGGDCNLWRPRAAKCLYLWRCGDWHQNTENRMPEVTQAQDHITILGSSACWQPEAAR